MEISIEQMAIGIAHAVYRNTEVEDYHAAGRVMDLALFQDVYIIVDKNLKRLFSAKELITDTVKNGISIPFNCPNAKPEDIEFLNDVLYGILCGLNWNQPHEIDDKIGEDLSEYLLNGVFINSCNGKRILDDNAMKRINQDITDRIYMILKYIIM